ncbi:hypothetical protein BSP14_179 [Bacillus phage BSP14]|nr:hypothetical protein BSP14_179 [Bacillus phage BSP14]
MGILSGPMGAIGAEKSADGALMVLREQLLGGRKNLAGYVRAVVQ